MSQTADSTQDEPTDHELRSLVAKERHRALAIERRQRYWLLRQAEESGTMAGVLADLVDRRADLVIQTVAGRTVEGRAAELGADHLRLRGVAGASHLVALAAIGVVSSPGARASTGDRPVPGGRDLGDVLRSLAPQRAVVSIVLADGSVLRGALRSAGQDLVTLWTDGAPRYLRTAAVAEVVVDDGSIV